MLRSAKFWIPMTVFQAAFGLTVFAITRQYYIQDSDMLSARPSTTSQPAPEWPKRSRESELEDLITAFPGPSIVDDPIALSNQADQYFANGQFDRAAELYERLLAADQNKASTYNNLGITLHYLGRSTEALRVLNQGVTADPAHQRIWLTLGFVNSQLGNTSQARTALTTAVKLDANTEVGQSAQNMLDALGPG